MPAGCMTMAPCCHPIPGDAIVGHIRKGQGLAVHQAEMAADATLDPARLALLGEHEPEALWLRLAPGAALVVSFARLSAKMPPV